MQINYLHGITKVFGHVKVAGKEGEYEPAIYILNEKSPRFQGCSFIIALSAMHKYVEPFFKYSNPKLIEEDRKKFADTMERVLQERNDLMGGIVSPRVSHDKMVFSNRELAALAFAKMLEKSNGILLVTGYNLGLCMQLFDITPCPAAAAQLLMFIEDGLDDLKNLGPAEPDTMFNAGGYQIFQDGRKIGSGDWDIPESKVIEERAGLVSNN